MAGGVSRTLFISLWCNSTFLCLSFLYFSFLFFSLISSLLFPPFYMISVMTIFIKLISAFGGESPSPPQGNLPFIPDNN